MERKSSKKLRKRNGKAGPEAEQRWHGLDEKGHGMDSNGKTWKWQGETVTRNGMDSNGGATEQT